MTVGVYDGLHDGHRHVICPAARRRAAELGGLETRRGHLRPAPAQVVAPEHAPRLLTGIDHRLELLAETGLDLAAVLPFDEATRLLTPAAFAATVLAGALRARLVVVGEDFRFGHHRAGNVASLAELGDAHGFAAEIVPLVGGQAPISSTRVRAMVAAGDVAGGRRRPGAPPRGAGHRGRGGRPGTHAGLPHRQRRLARRPGRARGGVYAVQAGKPGSSLRPGVANVGTRPTFGGAGQSLEVASARLAPGDLYGATLRVAFVSRLRDERRFDGPADLAAQIAADIGAARRRLGS